MQSTAADKKDESRRKAPSALVGLAVIFLTIFAVVPLGLIVDLHPVEAYTDTGTHSFVPYGIESKTDREHFRHIPTQTHTKHKVVYRSAGKGEYEWTDKHEYSFIKDAKEVVAQGAPIEKKVYTVADGSYVVDDAGSTPADYIKHTVVTNGTASLTSFALLVIVLRPWFKRNFLAPDAPVWTAERVKQGVATPLMMAGIVVATVGILDLSYAFDRLLGPFLPASLRCMLFNSPVTKPFVVAVGIALFVLGVRWSNRYGASADADDA